MLRREQIERLKERYPAGTVVRLGQMEGEHQMPSGMEGKVIGVDDIGQIHVEWEGSKKVCIICSFDITDKPSVHILAIHTSGSGLSVECSGIGRRKADGIFYCIDVFRSKSKVVILQLG